MSRNFFLALWATSKLPSTGNNLKSDVHLANKSDHGRSRISGRRNKEDWEMREKYSLIASLNQVPLAMFNMSAVVPFRSFSPIHVQSVWILRRGLLKLFIQENLCYVKLVTIAVVCSLTTSTDHHIPKKHILKWVKNIKRNLNKESRLFLTSC